MRGLSLAVVCCVLTSLCHAALPGRFDSKVTPKVAGYTIPANLAGVRDLDKAPQLSAAQREALALRGFVVIPDEAEQMFLLYEEYGDDSDKGPMPNFITVDSVLQAYHIFFDFSLRTIEKDYLIKYATELTRLCAGLAVRDLQQAPPGVLQDAAARNLAYFLVARNLLTGDEPGVSAEVPRKAEVIARAREELPKIAAHAGRAPSGLMQRTVHYDQFIPRGHYTRSAALGKYFKAMMWYGTLGFTLDPLRDNEDLARVHTLQALLIARMMSSNEWGASLWDRIYEPTDFCVGGADDLTWRDYLPIAGQVFGKTMPLTALADRAKLETFLTTARAKLPVPRIAPAFLEADSAGNLEQIAAPPQGRECRFMGQRFIPDSYAMQKLVWPAVSSNDDPRYWPMGLDVMAVLGSGRARQLLVETFKQDRYKGYTQQLDTLKQEFAETPESKWWSNLYWGWLHSLRPLLAEKGEGYPTFMRGSAWLDKELVTAQGSWAQLRHDTILYGKPSGAELGAAEPTMVEGYVEPYPEVFGRLAYLAVLSRDGLKQRKLLPDNLSEAYDRFEDTLMFLKTCAEKELQNQALTSEEYARIQFFGGELERLTLDVIEGGQGMSNWFQIQNEADREMATIADVHTSFDSCLEVGVGKGQRIYVVVPRPRGGLQLAKGGVMSYYEFKWPVSDRLTDEKWIEMLGAGKAPAMPAWTSSFMVP